MFQVCFLTCTVLILIGHLNRGYWYTTSIENSSQSQSSKTIGEQLVNFTEDNSKGPTDYCYLEDIIATNLKVVILKDSEVAYCYNEKNECAKNCYVKDINNLPQYEKNEKVIVFN